ncbi:hypothetical protein BT96DRAFT_987060 [Gymnopus androsaceus JB14]|uniref:Uncharacterized protein n=1 Tax=Gymnopus androsaceus JB14 TaxID=1447944 RepID=A0A6A4I931_9AGAR|nr:hypothetical protein BT96DRAFT_987060 [Gymnopus androsaceus JB14]
MNDLISSVDSRDIRRNWQWPHVSTSTWEQLEIVAVTMVMEVRQKVRTWDDACKAYLRLPTVPLVEVCENKEHSGQWHLAITANGRFWRLHGLFREKIEFAECIGVWDTKERAGDFADRCLQFYAESGDPINALRMLAHAVGRRKRRRAVTTKVSRRSLYKGCCSRCQELNYSLKSISMRPPSLDTVATAIHHDIQQLPSRGISREIQMKHLLDSLQVCSDVDYLEIFTHVLDETGWTRTDEHIREWVKRQTIHVGRRVVTLSIERTLNFTWPFRQYLPRRRYQRTTGKLGDTGGAAAIPTFITQIGCSKPKSVVPSIDRLWALDANKDPGHTVLNSRLTCLRLNLMRGPFHPACLPLLESLRYMSAEVLPTLASMNDPDKSLYEDEVYRLMQEVNQDKISLLYTAFPHCNIARVNMPPNLALDVLKQIKTITDELGLDLHWQDLSPWEDSRETRPSAESDTEPGAESDSDSSEALFDSSEEEIDSEVESATSVSSKWSLSMRNEHVAGFAFVQQSVEYAKVNPIIVEWWNGIGHVSVLGDAFSRFGMPYGEDAIAHARSTQDLNPPPEFEQTESAAASGSRLRSQSRSTEAGANAPNTSDSAGRSSESSGESSGSNTSSVLETPEIRVHGSSRPVSVVDPNTPATGVELSSPTQDEVQELKLTTGELKPEVSTTVDAVQSSPVVEVPESPKEVHSSHLPETSAKDTIVSPPVSTSVPQSAPLSSPATASIPTSSKLPPTSFRNQTAFEAHPSGAPSMRSESRASSFRSFATAKESVNEFGVMGSGSGSETPTMSDSEYFSEQETEMGDNESRPTTPTTPTTLAFLNGRGPHHTLEGTDTTIHAAA